MNDEKILISTFGRGESASAVEDDKAMTKLKVARRELPYNRLIVLTNSTGDAKLNEIANMDRKAGIKVDIVEVNAYDFFECFKKVDETIAALLPMDAPKPKTRKSNRKAVEKVVNRHKIFDNISVNFSGGTKILATATLIVCFNRGLKAYHCDSNGIREMPRINLYEFFDGITANDRKVLHAAENRINYDDLLKASKLTRGALDKSMKKLIECKWLEAEPVEGKLICRTTEMGLHYAAQLMQR